MSDRLKDLAELTQLASDVEMARLRAANETARGVEAEIARLDAMRTARAAAVTEAGLAGDPAGLAGRDAPWQTWLQRERARLLAEVARASAEAEAQKLAARRAFGRAEALRQLCARETAARRQAIVRRSDAGT